MLRRLLTPRWIAFALAVALLAALFVELGRWQLHRLHAREARNHVTVANLAAPPAPLDSILGPDRTVGPAIEWRHATATGRYDASSQIVAKYRNVDDRPGFEVVTPLVLTDGSAVLVDRGFLARTADSSQVPAIPPVPSGQVTVTGRLRHSEHGESAATTPVDNQVRLINAPAIAASTGLKLVDGYMTVDTQVPAADKAWTGLPPPEIDSGPHFFYAMQWFFFALLAVGGLVYFAREDVQRGPEGRTEHGSGRADGRAGARHRDPDDGRVGGAEPDRDDSAAAVGGPAGSGAADRGLRADRRHPDGGAGLD